MIGGKIKPAGELRTRLKKSFNGSISPRGQLVSEKMPGQVSEREYFWSRIKQGFPQKGLPAEINTWRSANLPNLWRGLRRIMPARMLNLPHFYGVLYCVVLREGIYRIEYGTASMRVVTDDGVDFIVDAFQNSTELEDMRYHGLGTNNAAEAAADSALGTELTTEYNPDNTRATGTLTEGGSTNIFRTVGTNTLDGAAAVVEHGIFSQAATGGGTLLDRSIFSVINLSASDGLETTFDLTIPAGS